MLRPPTASIAPSVLVFSRRALPFHLVVAVSRSRVFVIAVVTSIGLAAAGFLWSGARFGWTASERPSRLQADLARRIAPRVDVVKAAAVRAAALGDLVDAATTSRDRVAELFRRLSALHPTADAASVTIWIPTGSRPDHRALAWTDGPSENIGPGTLELAPMLFAAAGAGGLRLVYLQPIMQADRRVGVAAAEVILSTASIPGPSHRIPLVGSLAGPVPVVALDGVNATPRGGDLRVSADDGTALFDVTVAPDQLSASITTFRWRVIAVALIPWSIVVAGLFTAALRRRCAGRTAVQWLAWTAVLVLGVAALTYAVCTVLQLSAIPDVWLDAVWALAALATAAFVGGDALRRVTPLHAHRSPLQFVAQQLLAGVFLAGGVGVTEWLWQHRVNPASIEQWNLPVLPSSIPVALTLISLLLSQIATAWLAASALGLMASRWRIARSASRLMVAVALWLVPLLVWLAIMPRHAGWPLATALVVAAALAAFGVFANPLRRHYRHSSEVRRMVLLFAALFAPVLAAYPLAAASADQATRALIERDYGPATQAAQQPESLMAALTQVRENIDSMTDLPDLLREAGATVSGTELGFRVWNRTSLARGWIPSQIELYGPARTLVSKFAFNVPEVGILAPAAERTWPGTGCEWDAFGGVARLGAGERRMLHAERQLCGAGGEFLGAVVVRIVPDYRTLPFVASANPYYDAVGASDRPRADTRVSDLQVVVYGWSLRPIFVSGRTAWPLDQPIADQVYRSRQSFWTDRTLEERTHHVFFMNDRGGIYAVGYPSPTTLQHATRLAESAAILLLLFLIYLASTAIRWPAISSSAPPLGRLLAEIRSSFHRKLLLYFIAAAVLPVIVFAVAFGADMTSRLRADVEAEAGSVVLMARRVLDELSAAQGQNSESRPMPTDDVMVWTRQVVDQDVNLFEGSELRATSQRDLFTSRLLPTRTLATVYQRIAFEQRPVFVAADQLGAFRYLVAAAPVPGLGRDVILTVPLASRQREIERQIDELTQGVLTGAVALVLFAAALGASVAGRVSNPIARLTRATRLVAAGRFDEKLVADTEDELGRLVQDFNTMTQVLLAQRAELARTNQLKAWAEMSRQVAHDIKNPLTPIQLAAEHLQRVHDDAKRPLGAVVDQCLTTVLGQVKLLRKIASEFSTFAGSPTPRFESVSIAHLLETIVEPYRPTLPAHTKLVLSVDSGLPSVQTDRTLLARALTNLVENALQAMPTGGTLTVSAGRTSESIQIQLADTGVGMDQEGVRRAFEPYFSTKTAGSGLGLANARRNIELCGGQIELASSPGEGTIVTVTVPLDRRAAPGPS